VSDHVLRAWERRYGVLRPVRTAGGFRLYAEADLLRVRRMQALLASGLSPAQAAQAVLNEDGAAHLTGTPDTVTNRDTLAGALENLARALEGFDEPAAHAVLDRLLSTLTVETVLRQVVLPYLRQLGDRWERGEVSIAQEHFASNVIRSRLTSLGSGWGHGHGPRALLACAPGELHDMALLAFGIVLHRNGWRIHYLGPNTPLDDLVRLAGETGIDMVVLAATTPERFDGLAADLTRLADVVPLAIAGPGASRAVADAAGAHLLPSDPVTAAEQTASSDIPRRGHR